ncbi:MAG: DUF3795 domain-containing protein [Bacteroidales bacterium]
MKTLSACGLVCAECEFYQKTCDGCYAVQGQTFWALEMMPGKVCPLFQCAINERGYESCGDCAELPCATFREMKDPALTDEQHQESLKERISRLRN